ncbi:MAG TPA: acetyl-CoA C-acetyltransferase [Spirochaetota bacterium]|nr:acetyl-CoA C-acetyltransferase [Spirochaetota bacterium]HPU90093.1 acetyl-CoA C-acetyltransferase [Spirochaetota bacterium]
MLKDNDAVIVSAVRTPLGSYNGSLAGIGATDLGGIVIAEAVKRAGIDMALVQEIFMGIVLPCGYGQNPARQAAIKAGVPMQSAALSINKVCGSALMAVVLASELVKSGYADICVAGGMENMSAAPYFMPKARWGVRMGNAPLMDHMVYDGLWDVVNDRHMGGCNDFISREWSVSREDQDRYALSSYERALAAIANGQFSDEIVPVPLKDRKGNTVHFAVDECPRPTDYDALSKMRPAFNKDGFATAGNSSVISDGAAAVVVMSYAKAKELGAKPMVKIVASGTAGAELDFVLIAPIFSIPKVCAKAGIDVARIDLHEINEAFAGSMISVMRKLDLDRERVNVHGGGIALGHPIGASGARVLTTLVHEMKRRGSALGQASLCLGGAEAVTMIVENI